jgi:hypothetical protein
VWHQSGKARGELMERILHCYVEGRPGQWEAICIDFDLAVQGRSFDEAMTELQVAIREYLDYIKSLPEPERQRFFNRRVPLLVRVRFMLRAIIWWFNFRDSERKDFILPCAA